MVYRRRKSPESARAMEPSLLSFPPRPTGCSRPPFTPKNTTGEFRPTKGKGLAKDAYTIPKLDSFNAGPDPLAECLLLVSQPELFGPLNVDSLKVLLREHLLPYLQAIHGRSREDLLDIITYMRACVENRLALFHFLAEATQNPQYDANGVNWAGYGGFDGLPYHQPAGPVSASSVALVLRRVMSSESSLPLILQCWDLLPQLTRPHVFQPNPPVPSSLPANGTRPLAASTYDPLCNLAAVRSAGSGATTTHLGTIKGPRYARHEGHEAEITSAVPSTSQTGAINRSTVVLRPDDVPIHPEDPQTVSDSDFDAACPHLVRPIQQTRVGKTKKDEFRKKPSEVALVPEGDLASSGSPRTNSKIPPLGSLDRSSRVLSNREPQAIGADEPEPKRSKTRYWGKQKKKTALAPAHPNAS